MEREKEWSVLLIMKKWILFGIAHVCLISAFAKDPFEALEPYLGSWQGALKNDSPLEEKVSLTLSRQGNLLIIDLERETLLAHQKERIYVDWHEEAQIYRAVSDSRYTPAPRRDKVVLSKDSIAFESEPWEIADGQKMNLQWSLMFGMLDPPVPARIFLNVPTFRPSRDALTLTWTGTFNNQPLGVQSGTLYRKGQEGPILLWR